MKLLHLIINYLASLANSRYFWLAIMSVRNIAVDACNTLDKCTE